MDTTTAFEIRRIIRPRPPGSAAHAEVQEILARAVRQLGLAPFGRNGYLLPYHTDGNVRLANIAAVLPGRDPSLPPMILGAHYDTVPETPGADDNAAAIDVVFRALEGLKPGTFRHPVLAVFFDAIEGYDDFRAGRTPGVAGLEAPSSSVLRIRLSRPVPFFLHLLTLPDGSLGGLLAAQVVVKYVQGNTEQPALERTALVRPDLLNQPDEQLTEQLVAEVPVSRQPVEIPIATAGVHVHHLRKAVSVPRFTPVNNPG